MTWLAVVLTCAGCYAIKLAGLFVPDSVLHHRIIERSTDVMPAALLAALLTAQTVSSGQHLVVDLRLAGVAAAVILLLLRAPLAVVVAVATALTALLRLIP